MHRWCSGSALILVVFHGSVPLQAQISTPASVSATRCPPAAVQVRLGSDIASIVERAAEGTSFCVKAGEHRMQAITPKNGQSFHGEPGAILNGSHTITEFARERNYWVASRQAQRGDRRPDVRCVPDKPRCSFPEAVFIDNVPLVHAESLSQLVDGKFFFDYEAQKIYLSTDPSGRKIEASVSPFAFMGGAQDVLIEGLVVEKYSTPIQAGAIGYNIPSVGWTVRNNEVRLNSSIGVVVGTNSRVKGNNIHNNGNMGAGCVGNDILFEINIIAKNGYFNGLDTTWEGGGAKCAKTNRLIVRRNYISENNGLGFWTDIDNINTIYEYNIVKHNLFGGISHEISYSAKIRSNKFYDNGGQLSAWLWGGAIQIQNSQEVEVYGNQVIAYKGNGVSIIQQDRGVGAYGPYISTNNRIYTNVIVSLSSGHGASGALADSDLDGMKAGNNTLYNNIYYVPDMDGHYWAWVDGFYRWSDYRARSGEEAGSTVRLSADWPAWQR